MAVNFTKHQDEITRAWREVVDSKEKQCWAIFGYEGNTNVIKLMSTGSNGLSELVQELNCSLIQYALCRVVDKDQGLNKLVLINWQGDSAPLSRKGLCASHVGDVANYFKGNTQTITIRNDDEATQEYLMDQILKQTTSSRVNLPRSSIDAAPSADSTTKTSADSEANASETKVGSSYKKTDINKEIPVDRKSFWQQQEEEEKERLEEEKKRAAEKQAQFERERKAREETEAKKLAEAIKERDRLIEATRQADKRDSSSSQPSSILSSNQDNDDERVGRRSELIRLERNQETQSLISKGLIKNKRAIFEQASQQSQQSAANTMSRRPSGTVVSQRLNTFKSLDCGNSGSSAGSSSSASVEKLTNGFAKQVNVTSTSEGANKTIVKKQVETVKMTNDEGDQGFVSTSHHTTESINDNAAPAPTDVVELSLSPETAPPVDQEVAIVKTETQNVTPTTVSKETPAENGNGVVVDSNFAVTKSNGDSSKATELNGNPIIDSNGNSSLKLSKSPKQEQKVIETNEVPMNGKSGIMAKALYDYQAADNTEISFDPDDIIGKIEKVDPGWWHGSVMTGQYKGQSGLFPANYVEELLR